MLIRQAAFKAVLSATSKNNSRYLIQEVQVEPDGAVVATDGYVLLKAIERNRYADEDFPQKDLPTFVGNPTGPVLIDVNRVNKLLAAMPKRSTIPVLGTVQVSADGQGHVTLAATDLTTPCIVSLPADNDGRRFPNYTQVLPAADRPCMRVALSVDVLITLIKSARAVHGKALHGGTIVFEIPTKHTNCVEPLRITIPGSDVTVIGGVMPCRV